VAGLDPAAAHPAAADLDLVAGHQRAGSRQVLDVLGRHPLQHQFAAAARAACRQPDLDDSVDMLGWLPVGAGAVGRAGPAAGALWAGRRITLRERGSLAFSRPAQRLHFGPQPLVLGLQLLAFGLQPLLLVA
jgi:hypothetical protein